MTPQPHAKLTKAQTDDVLSLSQQTGVPYEQAKAAFLRCDRRYFKAYAQLRQEPLTGRAPMTYARPLNAGIPSEPANAGRRLGRLLDALDTHVNAAIVAGRIMDDLYSFKNTLLANLRADGWRVKMGAARWSVLPPKGEK